MFSFSAKMRSYEFLSSFFCQGFPGTVIPLILVSHVAEVTGVSHCAQLFVEIGSWEIFAWGNLELQSPDHSLPSSWDYRHDHGYIFFLCNKFLLFSKS
jgi:hypothetical protein